MMDTFGIPDRLCEMDESELSSMLLLENVCDEAFKSSTSEELNEIMQLDEKDCVEDFDTTKLDVVSHRRIVFLFFNHWYLFILLLKNSDARL